VTDLPAIDGLIETMTALLAPLRQRRDPRRFFLATYLRTTQAVRAELSAGGFADWAWADAGTWRLPSSTSTPLRLTWPTAQCLPRGPPRSHPPKRAVAWFRRCSTAAR
jgi:Family of unknown function (DUF5995)